jgi:hypothetical protein
MGGRKTKTRKVREIPLSEQLSNEELLQALETMVKALNVELRYEKAIFRGELAEFTINLWLSCKKMTAQRKKLLPQPLPQPGFSRRDICAPRLFAKS